MFYPIYSTGKLFRRYLRARSHPAKVRIQNWLGKYFFKDGITVRNESGTTLKLMPNDWMSRIMLMHNGYEESSVQLAKELVKHGGIFIDIGANFGLYTCTLSENKDLQVYAIEPNYMVIPGLLLNVQHNKRDNVTVLNAALSDRFQFLSLALPNKNNLGTASFGVKTKAPFSALSCSLTFIFKSLAIQEVELIKVDIEGNEFEVFRDFSFETCPVKNILLEFNDLSALAFEELYNFFTGKKFSVRDINGQVLNNKASHLPENNLWLVNTAYL